MTENQGIAAFPPSQIDPQRLTLLLEGAGWRIVGGRRAAYNRLSPPTEGIKRGSRQWTLLVPLDRDDPAFEELMSAALTDLREHAGRDVWTATIAPRLRSEPTDAFQFRKESAAPPGLISWRQGEDLISSARATMVAGAKSFREHQRRFGNRYGQFASRYLDTILMGQTAVGSYIVTAYAPVIAQVPLLGSKTEGLGLPDVEVAGARSITTAVSNAIEAASEALDHYRVAGSLSGFDANVEHGVSYDLAVALQGLTRDSDGADIRIDWDPTEPAAGSPQSVVYEFKGSDSAVLETAAHRLAETKDGPVRASVIGRVHLLTKKLAGGPGVFGLESIASPYRKFRVRLAEPEEYHLAVRAHDEDMAIEVSGDLEPEGTIAWLYQARVQRTIGTIDQARAMLEEGAASSRSFDEPTNRFDFDEPPF